TRILIDQLLDDGHNFTYFTIDISKKYLTQIVNKFNHELCRLKMIALNADYINGLKWLTEHSKDRNLVLFLGSSIGNFSHEDTHIFLKNICQDLQDGDYFLIGFDLRKDIDILLNAYNDSDGITRQFNLNLLTRINKELGGTFNLDQFKHHGIYNVSQGAMESYLISLKDQDVYIDALNKSFHFEAYEPIHLEYSYKYSMSQITDFAQSNGFTIIENFFDEKKFFVNSLWRITK
ncbi:MAG: L-histidine N(alpha)-methyltransferase, partial [bacterium]|nr:L-histidine N(alpha)-methyltransferase [bacterium]